MDVGACDELLLVLTVHMLRGSRRPLDGTVETTRLYLRWLRSHYTNAGALYGDDELGFQRWLLDL